jgi:undecaprenyl diphosphate synthase
MKLVKQYLQGELDFYRENHIRIRHAGDPRGLPVDIAAELKSACEETASFPGTQVVLALNYGGRDEIVRALKRLIAESGGTPSISEETIRSFLDNPDIPDPDLVIRSAGEYRTSNFLLWEAAYSEYYVSDLLWPDWTKEEFDKALAVYGERRRKFGGTA